MAYQREWQKAHRKANKTKRIKENWNEYIREYRRKRAKAQTYPQV
jgi:hypothetical protein